jgi:hypothetical protein
MDGSGLNVSKVKTTKGKLVGNVSYGERSETSLFFVP